jgi:hypothetical protein
MGNFQLGKKGILIPWSRAVKESGEGAYPPLSPVIPAQAGIQQRQCLTLAACLQSTALDSGLRRNDGSMSGLAANSP